MMIFCLLDRATVYRQVCIAFDMLDQLGLTDTWRLRFSATRLGSLLLINKIKRVLEEAGYRFPLQAARTIVRFAVDYHPDLRTAPREDLVDWIYGLGMKLASMFLARTRPEEGPYAILDRHLHRWLERHGCTLPRSDYLGRERFFLDWCTERELDPVDYDLEIWERSRI
ncbi:MAG: hypothetical protein ACE5JL_18920 [Dehalococcoidia bacterium]